MSQSRISFEDYDGFVEKFKPKRTTDDCYTPPEVYDVVASYVERRFGIARERFVRPFFPGGDYERFEYPEGCCVVDNPPFSILSRIKRFYMDVGVPFFLFCPSLTALSSADLVGRLDHIICDANITYENGAVVRTAFVTDMEPRYVIEADPDLGDAINAVCSRLRRKAVRVVPKYEYPDAVLTAARCQWLAAHHASLRVRHEDACRISAMDAQRACGKSIFGGGLLLSKAAAAERAAAERAAAERAAAEHWQLSEAELSQQALLG